MRKALIAVAVATALFAVGAFAASFTVQSEDIASGANPVDQCAALVNIEFGDLVPPVADGDDFTVESATATFLNGTTVSDDCEGFDATLSLTVDGTPTTFGPVVVATGVATFDLLDLNDVGLDVGPITNAAVAVEGEFLPAGFVLP